MEKIVNVTFAGLGGQGVLKASDILAEAAFAAGFDVKKSEVHGMSQRGGSVSSEVRYGAKVNSPMVPDGETDFLVVLSEDQVEVNRHRLRQGGIMIAPADIPAGMLDNPKSINVALLGLLCRHLPEVQFEQWLAAVSANLPAKLRESNLALFRKAAGKAD